VDYGGDEWGDDDEYDPPPPPMPRTVTGLRQPGQAAQSDNPRSPLDAKKGYGELPAIPVESQDRSTTNTVRERANSFDKDDERRAFSGASTSQQPTPDTTAPGPATRFSQIVPGGGSAMTQSSVPPVLQLSTRTPSITGLRKPINSGTSAAQSPQVARGRGTPVEEPMSGTSSHYSQESGFTTNLQNRRDFSPSAVPSPLQPRTAATPQSATDSTSTKFPPRKGSIGQVSQPELSEASAESRAATTPKLWPETTRSQSPGTAQRSPPTSTKALPFIRPADIYKKLEEQREKDRQSLDSSRPSMDSIAKDSDRSASPAPRIYYQAEPSSDNPGTTNTKGGATQYETTDSSRRLFPVLEPVTERKSEYGFDTYNTTNKSYLAATGSEDEAENPSDAKPQYGRLDVEEIRRFSTSPKLPDLNRMSGFGMDFFSQSKPESEAPHQQASGPVAEAKPKSYTPDSTLRSQQSQGLASVVHQAFDTPDDTLATDLYDGVKRAESESTGTTEITPIMSHISSSTLLRGKDHDTQVRESSNPIATEESDEVDSRKASAQTSGTLASTDQVFLPGHRRDISTPSPGNSPAITPNVTKSEAYSTGESTPISDPNAINAEDLGLVTPRPLAGRDRSFRPDLPGGWVSNDSTKSNADNSIKAGRVQRAESQAPDSKNQSTKLEKEQDDEDDEDDEDPSSAIVRTQVPLSSAKTSDLPTFDPALAPIGNPYAALELDPRLDSYSPPDSVVPSTRAAAVATTPASTILPTPPPKDTPNPQFENDTEYFAPTVPLQMKPYDGGSNMQELKIPTQPHLVPSFSTQTSPQDEESDKLRKEIVKSLSPQGSEFEQREPIDSYDTYEEGPDGLGISGTRESTYLPSEYDNYWASTNEDELPEVPEVPLNQKAESIKETSSTAVSGRQAMLASASSAKEDVADITSIQPLKAKQLDPSSADTRPALLTNRFSWEAGSEQVLEKAEGETIAPVTQASESTKHPLVNESETQTKQLNELSEQPSDDMFSNAPEVAVQGQNLAQFDEKIPMPVGSEVSAHFSAPGPEVGLAAGEIAPPATAYVGHQVDPKVQPARRLSLAEEKSPANISTYAVTQTPPEDDHPSKSPQALQSSQTTQHSTQLRSGPPSAQGESTQQVYPRPIQTVDLSKITQFQDILSMGGPDQRIRAYNDSRQQFAVMDSGLNEWIVSLKNAHPEHVAYGASGAQPVHNNAQSRLGKPPNATSPPLQQPYFQQYLNASSPTATTPPTSRPSTAAPSSQQGFSQGGQKLTGQQVQAKSKELLHSAGIFGGKASKAGKGLLAKGKSKLRGGGDKVE
jgi:hypothetical protein